MKEGTVADFFQCMRHTDLLEAAFPPVPSFPPIYYEHLHTYFTI